MASVAETLSKLGLPPEEIASRTRLSLDRVLALLHGSDVAVSELRALTTGLKLPARAFSTAGLSARGEGGSIRYRNTRSKSEFDPTSERVANFVQAALKILPARDSAPAWIEQFWALNLKYYEDAERASLLFREILYPEQEEEPAIGLPQRLNSLDGIIVSQLNNSRYEGCSLVAGGYVFIFVSPRFPGRMLFTLAHELGHVLAGHVNQIAHYDLSGDIGRLKNPEEAFADNFASAFLLPMSAIGRSLSSIRDMLRIKSDAVGDIEIILLSRFFGVSFDVTARRCERLKLLPSGGAYSLSQYVRENFKSPELRAEAAKLPPRQAVFLDLISPLLLAEASRKIDEGQISPTWVADQFGISIDQLQRLHSNLDGHFGSAH
jgi:Zn-dependent peptidase ImmA (M78 family)